MESIDNFIDKKGRLIEIKVDEYQNFCFAFHNGGEIGKFKYDIQDEYLYIFHMNVKYKNSGIGKKLLKALSDFYNMPIEMPNPYEIDRNAKYYLINDGPQFKQSCIDSGIVSS